MVTRPRTLQTATLRTLVVAAALALSAPASAGSAATGWLGDGSGRFEGARVPSAFSATEGVTWTAATPSWGNASPVVVGDRVCVTSEPATLLCFARATGRELWRHAADFGDTVAPSAREQYAREVAQTRKLEAELADAVAAHAKLKRSARKARGDRGDIAAQLEAQMAVVTSLREQLERRDQYRDAGNIAYMGRASATPATDGRLIYGVFGNGIVLAIGVDGQVAWARFLGRPEQQMNGYHRGQAAAPRLVDGTLVVALNHLVGLDPKTGADRWRGDTYLDFGAPVPVQVGGRWFVATPSGAVVRVSDGEVVAKAKRAVWYASPIANGSRVYNVGAGQTPQTLDRDAWALELSPAGDGVSIRERWHTTLQNGKTYASPHLHDGILYSIAIDGTLAALNADTGEIFYQERLDLGPSDAVASIVSAGETVVVGAEGGTIARVATGPTFRILGTHALAPYRGTPALVGDTMYIRALDKLWAISE